MDRRLSRRQILALGGGALSSGAIAAAGLSARGDDPREASWPYEELVIDEGDPSATPLTYVSQSGVRYRAPTATPTSTSTPTATPTATPTPTPTAIPERSRPLEPRPAWDSPLLRQVVRGGPSDRPLVALTIDDGWSARDEVLRILKEKKAFPTFFLAGRAIAGDKGFVARALDSGCEIANHTMDHYTLTDKSASYIEKDLRDFEDLVRAQVTGATTLPYMRPSGGAVNQGVIDASAAAGYRVILWSGSTGDGLASTTASEMVVHGLNAARPGAILLAHFGPRTAAALPALIDGIRAKGLEPVSLSRLFRGDPPAPI